MVGGVLSVTVKVEMGRASWRDTSLTCSVTGVTPRPTRVPAVGVCVIDSGVELLQSVATTPLVKSGTGAWQRPLAKEIGRAAWRESVGGVLSVTVKVEVQVDSLVAPSLTCSVTGVMPRPTRVPAVGVCVINSGVELLQSVATTTLFLHDALPI